MKKEDLEWYEGLNEKLSGMQTWMARRVPEVLVVVCDEFGIKRDRINEITHYNSYDGEEAVAWIGPKKITWDFSKEGKLLPFYENGKITFDCFIEDSKYAGGKDVKLTPGSSALKLGSVDFQNTFPTDYLWMADEEIRKDVQRRIKNSEKDKKEKKMKAEDAKRMKEKALAAALEKLTEHERKLLGVKKKAKAA
mgnify:FL=1